MALLIQRKPRICSYCLGALKRLFTHHERSALGESSWPLQKNPDGVISTQSTPPHSVVPGYLLDSHFDKLVIPTDIELDALPCGGVSPKSQKGALLNANASACGGVMPGPQQLNPLNCDSSACGGTSPGPQSLSFAYIVKRKGTKIDLCGGAPQVTDSADAIKPFKLCGPRQV